MESRCTVIITCYNHESYVEEALESVLDQTVRPSQLIVTDDASTDDSAERIAKWLAERWPDALFIRNRHNQGLPSVLNAAIPQVSGEYLAIMSADDRMRPDRLEMQSHVLERESADVGMVYSNMLEVYPDGKPTGQHWFDLDRQGPAGPTGCVSGEPIDLFPEMISRAFMAAPTVLVRARAIRQVGRYDESLMAEDYDMFLRLSRGFRWIYIDDSLIYYRVLPTSLARTPEFKNHYRYGRIYLLRKHLGVSPDTDKVISCRIGKMAGSLYQEGRSAVSSRVDLWLAFRGCPSKRTTLLLFAAVAGVPGPALVRITSFARKAARAKEAAGGYLEHGS